LQGGGKHVREARRSNIGKGIAPKKKRQKHAKKMRTILKSTHHHPALPAVRMPAREYVGDVPVHPKESVNKYSQCLHERVGEWEEDFLHQLLDLRCQMRGGEREALQAPWVIE
jgi:hypothetical protein